MAETIESGPRTFAQWLNANRRRARYSIRELAAEAGVSHSYIAKIEALGDSPREMRPRPSQQVVVNIARVLEADSDTALRLAGWMPSSGAGEIERITDREREWIANYRSMPSDRQELFIKLAAELAKSGRSDDTE